MATELKKYTDAYATMTVAVYEPLIVKWISGWSVLVAADTMALRLAKAKYMKLDEAFATAQALNVGKIRAKLPRDIKGVSAGPPPPTLVAVDNANRMFASGDVRAVKLEGFPDAVAVGDRVYPQGVLNVEPEVDKAGQLFRAGTTKAQRPKGNPYMGVKTLPIFVSGGVGVVDPDFDFAQARKQVFKKMISAVEATVADPKKVLAEELHGAIRSIGDLSIYDFWPTQNIEEKLSPIGIAHFYRQHYFNIDEGVGPLEEAFTIAPLETLEVVYENVRRLIHEEFLEVGSEAVSETAVETKNLDEVSDMVSSMIQRDSSASMSTSGSVSTPVYQFGAEASTEMSVSTQRGREETSRRLKEVNKRASERITRSFSIKTRDIEDVTTTNLTRRVIRNESEHPVSYGLRRVLRRVRVKVQDLGPRLVWQLYIRNPGEGLSRSRFVHFREAESISAPELPPGVQPRPKGGIDTGTTSATLDCKVVSILPPEVIWFVTLVIRSESDRVVEAVSIDSITDLEGGGKDDPAPSPRNDESWPPESGEYWDPGTNTYTVNIAVNPGDARAVSVTYTYTWEPHQDVVDDWEKERKKAVAAITEELLNEQFEREKELITERSKIRPRPANDLRREERFETMNRMISQLFARGDDPSEPTPLEIEYFHRYFNLEGMFIYTHPSWWKPRYSPVATGLRRPAYEITAESEPAPMGSSLGWTGWMIQLDGDTRRNEFLNSPWVRVCLPIHPGREREAVEWLAKHVEGEFGYDVTKDPLKILLENIEEFRANEEALGIEGADYVTVESSVGAPEGPLRPEKLYPIIEEFDVTVPTDGFVYDELTITD